MAATPHQPAKLPKRFYKRVSVEPAAGGFQVLLDDRPVRTPMKLALSLPTERLAMAIAGEWEGQQDRIDPATMALTRLSNSVIDGVMLHRDNVIDDITHFAASDLVCYRAQNPADLKQSQSQHWDPLVAWAENALQAEFKVVSGVMPVAQSRETLSAVRDLLADLGSYALASAHEMTTLIGSAVIALASLSGHLSPEEAWGVAHLDEAWQEAQWGQDGEAVARLAAREADFRAAFNLALLAGEIPARSSL